MAGLENIQNATPQGGLSAVPKPGEMKPYDIIKTDIEKFNLDLDPNQTYAKMLQMVQQPQYRVLRANDSLIFMENHKDGTADGMMFTADKPQKFVASLKIFNKAFKAAKIHTIAFGASGMAIEPLLKKAKIKFDSRPIKGGSKITVHIQ
jgi:hypothetical protein